MISLLIIFSLPFVTLSNLDIISIRLNKISYNKLSQLDESSVIFATHVLTTTGILKISSIPNLNTAQLVAFSSLSHCLETNTNDKNDVYETVMNDGRRRLTIGAKSINGQAGRISHNCGESSIALRSIVDMVTRQLIVALDSSSLISNFSTKSKSDTLSNSDDTSYLMKPYQSFESIIDKGEHLEHLHSFYNTKKDSEIKINNKINSVKSDIDIDQHATLEMHTDAGLFIAMTTGYYSNDSHNFNTQKEQGNQRGLYITLPSGKIAHVTESDLTSNDLIIMIGQGGADWLSPRLGASFRAVPHALIVDLGENKHATRSWYGKMYLPPLDAELYKPTGVTYQEYRNRQLTSVQSAQLSTKRNLNAINSHPAACGENINDNNHIFPINKSENENTSGATTSIKVNNNEPAFRLLVPETCKVSQTNEPGVMCWQRCVATAPLHCSSNAYATCIDTANGQEVDGNIMCPSKKGMSYCKAGCMSEPTFHPTAIPLTSSHDSTTTHEPTQSSLSGLIEHQDTTTDKSSSDSSFCIGTGTSMSMIGFISSATETGKESECFLYLFPSWVLDSSGKFVVACLGTLLLGISIHGLSKIKLLVGQTRYHNKTKFWLNIIIYFFQMMFSYLIMLVSMTYNVELFFMVCFGLTLGYGIFHPQNTVFSNLKSSYETIPSSNPNPTSKYSSTDARHNENEMSSVHVEPCCAGLDYDAISISSNQSHNSPHTSILSSNTDINTNLLPSDSLSSSAVAGGVKRRGV